MIHESHKIIYRQGMEAGACSGCSKCACHNAEALTKPCESAPVFDPKKIQKDLEAQMWEHPLFEGEIPVYYYYGMTVIGHVTGIKLPNHTVVLRITLREGDGLKIIEMMEGKLPLELGFTLREYKAVKRVDPAVLPEAGQVQASQD